MSNPPSKIFVFGRSICGIRVFCTARYFARVFWPHQSYCHSPRSVPQPPNIRRRSAHAQMIDFHPRSPASQQLGGSRLFAAQKGVRTSVKHHSNVKWARERGDETSEKFRISAPTCAYCFPLVFQNRTLNTSLLYLKISQNVINCHSYCQFFFFFFEKASKQSRRSKAQCTKDYRCEDGRVPVTANCLHFQTPIRFPAMKHGLGLEYKAKKKSLLWMKLMSESHWWNLFNKDVKSWDSTTCFRI
jgi:hypothetical protein